LALAALAGSALALSGVGAQAKVEGDTIILGSAISFTGKYSTNGVHAQRGYDIAIERINEMGGVKVNGESYKLAVQYYDDESTPARGAQLAERLINQDGIKYILGPYSSGLTKAIAPVTEKYKIPMVEAEGASRSLFTQGYRYLFAVLSTSEQYLASSIDLAAEIAKKNGKDPSEVRIAMAFENDPFSLDVRQGVVDDAERYGMQIVVDDKLPRDLSDMSATLTKVKALGRHGGASIGRAEDRHAHGGDDPLRIGGHHRQVRCLDRRHPLPDPVGGDAELRGRLLRHGGRLRRRVQGPLSRV
jgi:branched-chain amino acid transport system substrate-binding protein